MATTAARPSWNDLLPPTQVESIAEEGCVLLGDIKQSLVDALLTGNMENLSCLLQKADRYLDLKFELSDADRVWLLKVCHELFVLPDMDTKHQSKLCSLMARIIKKMYLTLDIEIDWKPYYDVLAAHFFTKCDEKRFVYVSVQKYGRNITRFLRQARRYFPASATQEILDRLRPQLCPNDTKAFEAIGFYCVMLPTVHDNYHLWLDESMGMWEWSPNSHPWDALQTSLLARLAEDQIGVVEMGKYLPRLFTHFLRICAVPVGTSLISRASAPAFPRDSSKIFGKFDDNTCVGALSRLIVYSLHMEDECKQSCLDHLERLFGVLLPFYHPSNGGKWSPRLGFLLHRLCDMLCHRVGAESKEDCTVPECARLTPDVIDRFVTMIQPVLMLSLQAKNPRVRYQANQTSRFLAYLRPNMIFPPLLDMVYPALTTLTESHRTMAALETLGSVAAPLFSVDHYPEGVQHMLPILQLTIPGIDVNDPMKTFATMRFFSIMLSVVPLVDASNRPEPAAMTDVEYEARSAMRGFEDWIYVILGRIMALFDHMGTSGALKSAEMMGGSIESGFGRILASVATTMFMQMSPPLCERAARKIHDFTSSTMIMDSLKLTGNFVAAAARGHPSILLALYVPSCVQSIKDEIASAGVDTGGNALKWNLRMLNQVVKYGGAELLKYREEIIEITQAVLPSTDMAVIKEGGKVWRNTIKALSNTYVAEWRSQPPSVWESEDFQSAPWKWWGRTVERSDMAVAWHEATEEEASFAFELLSLTSDFAFERLEGSQAKENVLGARDVLHRDLMILRNSIRASNCMQLPIKEADHAHLNVQPAAVTAFLNSDVEARGRAQRFAVLLHSLAVLLLEERGDDTKALKLVAKAVHALLAARGCPPNKLMIARGNYVMWKSATRNPLVEDSKHHIRGVCGMRAEQQFMWRLCRATYAIEDSDVNRQLRDDLFTMSISAYSKVRVKGQNVLRALLVRRPEWQPCIISRCAEIVGGLSSDAESGNPSPDGYSSEAVTGCCYLLSAGPLSTKLCGSMSLVKETFLAICYSWQHGKLSVQGRLAQLFDVLQHTFRTLPLRAARPVESPPACMNGMSISDGASTADPDANLRNYEELISSLLLLHSNEPNLHWKYLSYVAHMLLMLQRKDYVPSEDHVLFMLDMLVCEVDSIRRVARHGIHRICSTLLPTFAKVPIKNKARLTGEDFKALSTPRSEEEWNNTEWLDRNYLGWNGFAQDAETHAPPVADITTLLDDVQKARRAVILARFTDEAYVARVVSWIETLPREGNTSFDRSIAGMYRGVLQLCRDAPLEVLKPHLVRMATTFDQVPQQVTAAEMVGGILRASTLWSYKELEGMWTFMADLLARIMPDISAESQSDWDACMRFAVADRDPRRFEWLTSFLFADPMRHTESSLLQSKALHNLAPVLVEFSWRGLQHFEDLVDELRSHVAHPYKQVRHTLVSALTASFKYTYEFPRSEDSGWCTPLPPSSPRPFVRRFMESVFEVLTQFDVEGSKELPADLSPEDTKTLSNARKVALMVVHSLFEDGQARVLLPFGARLLSHVWRMVDDPEQPVSQSAKATLTCMASYCDPYSLKDFLSAVSKAVDSPSWRQREHTLPVLQLVVFNHTFYGWSARGEAVDVAVRLMSLDPQVEVRELASTSLTGMIVCLGDSVIPALADKFLTLSAKTLKKMRKLKKKKKTPEIEQKISALTLQRHAGVLGLAALTRVDPYQVPSWMPPVLMALADHFDAPMPVKATVKSAFADFWRTHRDTWDYNKDKFTLEELELLQSTRTSSYNYFA